MKQVKSQKMLKVIYVTKNMLKNSIKGNFAMVKATDHVNDITA